MRLVVHILRLEFPAEPDAEPGRGLPAPIIFLVHTIEMKFMNLSHLSVNKKMFNNNQYIFVVFGEIFFAFLFIYASWLTYYLARLSIWKPYACSRKSKQNKKRRGEVENVFSFSTMASLVCAISNEVRL